MSYQEYWGQMYEQNERMNSMTTSYWNQYSAMDSWQFWVVAALLVLPLVLLYFKVDRSKILLLFFFGYTVHILWTYIDIVLERYNFFVHTYFIAPIFPHALNMTASVLPAVFLLLYQYCLNHNKNFFLYTIILSALFSFILVPLEMYLGLVKLGKGMQLYHVFVIDVAIAYAAYLLTTFVRRLTKTIK